MIVVAEGAWKVQISGLYRRTAKTTPVSSDQSDPFSDSVVSISHAVVSNFVCGVSPPGMWKEHCVSQDTRVNVICVSVHVVVL